MTNTAPTTIAPKAMALLFIVTSIERVHVKFQGDFFEGRDEEFVA
eukprot:CAMPEP_0172481016 /NCGR_PEP_ID=MMETSP1066-20121228/6536_1 /TAXON_ID=671091 /ORGANISM="Coscinodiscus wailesii, Strain CCMP2513" /LENGTH=44 /DNA_ID= /DNA_START= /DNA_END= /DNA_ORIENTATION=